jgi:imidazole glycerol-phosphate synthase subunit HisF
MMSRRLIPCLDVRDGQVVKGVRFRDHVVMGAIEELALRYRDAGRRRAGVLRHHREPRGPHRRSRLGRARGTADRHPLLRGRRHPLGRAMRARCSRRRRQGLGELAGAGAARADRRTGCEAFGVQCVVVGIDSLRDVDGEWRVRQYTGDPARRARWPAHARLGGRGAAPRRRRDRAQLHGHRRRARRATTSNSCAPCARSAACRWSPVGRCRHAEHFAEVFDAADVDARSPPASSTRARSHSRTQATLARPASRCVMSETWWSPDRRSTGLGQAGRPAAGGGAGRRHPARADAGLHESRGAGATLASRQVTFFSRSKGRLWTKGEAAATCSSWSRSRPTATPTRCWSRRGRRGRPATSGGQLLSRCAGLSFLGDRSMPDRARERERPPAATPPSCSRAASAEDRAEGRRGGCRDRAGRRGAGRRGAAGRERRPDLPPARAAARARPVAGRALVARSGWHRRSLIAR